MKVFTECAGVMVIKNGHVLLGKRVQGDGWALAGGKVDPVDWEGRGHERFIRCATRELKEEFGITATQMVLFCIITAVANVKGERHIVSPNIFLCTDWLDAPTPTAEMPELKWFPIEKEIFDEHLFEPTKAALVKYMFHNCPSGGSVLLPQD